MTKVLETHRALLSRLLPHDRPDGLTVRRGQFHLGDPAEDLAAVGAGYR